MFIDLFASLFYERVQTVQPFVDALELETDEEINHIEKKQEQGI